MERCPYQLCCREDAVFDYINNITILRNTVLWTSFLSITLFDLESLTSTSLEWSASRSGWGAIGEEDRVNDAAVDRGTSGLPSLLKAAILAAVAAILGLLALMTTAEPAHAYTCSPSHFPVTYNGTTTHTRAASSTYGRIPGFSYGSIRYRISSRYATQISSGITKWDYMGNNYPGGPDWQQHTLGTRLDLEYFDAYRQNSWAGLYTYSGLGTVPDKIEMNVWALEGHYLTDAQWREVANQELIRRQRYAVASHESGHAVGLGDHYGSYYKVYAIMYKVPGHTCLWGPARHDVNDFNDRW